MRAPADAIDLIKRFEGCRLQAYADSVGVPTIGYGHTAGVALGDACTQQQADDWLAADAEIACGAVLRQVKKPLSSGQLAALVSFVFNLGASRLAGSTLLKLVNSGDMADAAEEFGKWVHAGAAVLPGLVRRREAERALFES